MKTVTVEEAAAAVGVHLATGPLYTKLPVALDTLVPTTSHFYPNSIRRECPRCGHATSWTHRERPRGTVPPLPMAGTMTICGEFELVQHQGGTTLGYTCAECEKEKFAVWVRMDWLDEKGISSATATASLAPGRPAMPTASRFCLEKIGQSHAPSEQAAKAVANALDKVDLALYRRALTSIGHGYGIGAMAYLRRVVENEIGRLLGTVAEAARKDDDDEAATAIENAMKNFSATERLKIAAKGAPSWLRAGGHNPLAILYKYLSTDLHGSDDATCVKHARLLQGSYEAVLVGIRNHRDQQAELAKLASSPS